MQKFRLSGNFRELRVERMCKPRAEKSLLLFCWGAAILAAAKLARVIQPPRLRHPSFERRGLSHYHAGYCRRDFARSNSLRMRGATT